ncbi:MAG TPA: aldo/keto reductase [Burkholderiales bacterium]|nr:aldo/keto reductase [Burkholderiales bacterium]
MEHIRFGSTGLQVSRLCLGTMTFGLQCDEATSFAILETAARAGVTFIDTADVYPLGGTLDDVGRTEAIIGKWLRGRREQFIIATKCSGKVGAAAWQQGTSRKHVMDAIDGSLRRLGTDYVDLYQVHHFDPNTPTDETLQAFDAVVRSGKARYIGCSNYPAWRLGRALGRSEVLGVAKFASVQPRYNLLFRQIERELLPLCEEEKLAVMPYNPLAGGLLTGKHKRSAAPPPGTRFTLGKAAKMYTERYWHDREFDAIEAIAELSRQAGIEMTTLAVAWTLAHPAITSAIIGASRPEQLAASLAAAEMKLDPGLKTKLDELTHEFRMGDAPR